jgi:hypothetical protein
MNVTALIAANCRPEDSERKHRRGRCAVSDQEGDQPSAPAAAIASTVGDDQPIVGGWMNANVMAGEEHHHHHRQRACVIDLVRYARVP